MKKFSGRVRINLRSGVLTMKRFLAVFLCLCLVGIGGFLVSAKAENYALWIAGVQVTDTNTSGTAGDGTWNYNASTKTLTLENTTIIASDGYDCIRTNIDGMTICLKGTNSLGGSGTIIDSTQNFTIKGQGAQGGEAVLIAEGNSDGLCAEKDLTIS